LEKLYIIRAGLKQLDTTSMPCPCGGCSALLNELILDISHIIACAPSPFLFDMFD